MFLGRGKARTTACSSPRGSGELHGQRKQAAFGLAKVSLGREMPRTLPGALPVRGTPLQPITPTEPLARLQPKDFLQTRLERKDSEQRLILFFFSYCY